MLAFKATSQFRKDLRRATKRGQDISRLREVIDDLLAEKPLAERYRDHALLGRYAGFRECHVAPDWLLIYRIDHSTLVLLAQRTGTHDDLGME
jgi:mRNA interferase YafQ